MHTKNRFLQGIYPFTGRGHRQAGAARRRRLSYPVPDGVIAQALYFRGGNTTDELITVVLMRDGVPMRYFPIGAKADVHVPLRVVEDLEGGTVIELHLAAPEGLTGIGRRRPRPGGGLMTPSSDPSRIDGRHARRQGPAQLVVIGNGMAGARTVEEILARGGAEQFSITMFGDEPYGNYNRIMLSHVLSGEETDADIFLNTPAPGTSRTTSPCTPGCGSTRIDRFAKLVFARRRPGRDPVRRADHRHRQPLVHPADRGAARPTTATLTPGVFAFRTHRRHPRR